MRKRLAAAGMSHTAGTPAGHPAEQIVEEAREAGADEIVMGSRGLSGLSSLLLGSVATQVLHSAEVPVTIVK